MSSAAVLPRLAGGGTVVCLASGPSLTTEDVDYVRGKATVIVINDAVRLAPWADVLYSSDSGWWERHKGMPGFAGLRARVSAALWRGHGMRTPKPHGLHPGVLLFQNTGERGIEFEPWALRTGNNSGHSAVNLAVHLGAARIVLLGYDMGTERGRNHFYDTGPTMTRSPFLKWRKLMATTVEPLTAAGIVIVNCSRATALECFQRAKLRETL